MKARKANSCLRIPASCAILHLRLLLLFRVCLKAPQASAGGFFCSCPPYRGVVGISERRPVHRESGFPDEECIR